MKRNYISNSGAYTSPGTPDYGDYDGGGATPKGWSSERVALPGNSSRRHISAAVLMPFNSGRALPSKWDDAERWITSPVPSGYVPFNKTTALQIQRRPKSKSGPLGPPGVMQLHNHSPNVLAALEGGNGNGSGSGRNIMVGSPFATGVLVPPDGVSIYYGVDNAAKSNLNCNDCAISQSDYGFGLSNSVTETSNPDSRDDKLDGSKEDEAAVSRAVSRRDMATQMSPDGSTHSSRTGRLSFSAFPSVESPAELRIRDVQVDKSVNNTKLSDKNGAKKMRNASSDCKDELGSPWDVKHSRKNASKLRKEEAKITAWENFQKAKAEAAIHKLEAKLEKERSASMDKILNKLKAAEMKAQEKRSSIIDNNQVNQSPRNSHKGLFCKYTKTGSIFRCCFFCT